MYICKYEKLVEFNLAVANLTTKPSNLIPHQIFWLYGMLTSIIIIHVVVHTMAGGHTILLQCIVVSYILAIA